MGNFTSNSWKLALRCRRDGEEIIVSTRGGLHVEGIKGACGSRGKLAYAAVAEEAITCVAPQRAKRPTCEEA